MTDFLVELRERAARRPRTGDHPAGLAARRVSCHGSRRRGRQPVGHAVRRRLAAADRSPDGRGPRPRRPGSPGRVTAAAGAVWIHDRERGRLLKVDARTNRVVKTLAVARDSDFAFAAGALWGIGERGLLVRVDPATAAVTQRVSLGGAAPSPTGSPTGLSLAAAATSCGWSPAPVTSSRSTPGPGASSAGHAVPRCRSRRRGEPAPTTADSGSRRRLAARSSTSTRARAG